MTSYRGRDETVLQVQGLAKRYSRNLRRAMAYGVSDILLEIAGLRGPVKDLRPAEFWALQNLTFEVPRGTSLGLVGPNGSGKTTLLKLISGLIKPDQGRISVRGRVAPLIALGAGFSPVLSGRENVFINMAILGLDDKEIRARFDEVLDFAEIGDAIDAPVQTYSSGMAARLGFSCAIHTAPNLLLIDEVLSVGDMRFRSKCYRRLAELKRSGTAFVLVSHNTNAIISMCDSVLYLTNGREVMRGAPADVMARFEEDLINSSGQSLPGEMVVEPRPPSQSSGLDILGIHFRDSEERKIAHPSSGEAVDMCVDCEAHRVVDGVSLGMIVRHASGELEPIINLASDRDGVSFDLQPGVWRLACRFPACGLRPGIYSAKVYLSQRNLAVLDAVESFKFEVKSRLHIADSAYFQPRQWLSPTASCRHEPVISEAISGSGA